MTASRSPERAGVVRAAPIYPTAPRCEQGTKSRAGKARATALQISLSSACHILTPNVVRPSSGRTHRRRASTVISGVNRPVDERRSIILLTMDGVNWGGRRGRVRGGGVSAASGEGGEKRANAPLGGPGSRGSGSCRSDTAWQARGRARRLSTRAAPTTSRPEGGRRRGRRAAEGGGARKARDSSADERRARERQLASRTICWMSSEGLPNSFSPAGVQSIWYVPIWRFRASCEGRWRHQRRLTGTAVGTGREGTHLPAQRVADNRSAVRSDEQLQAEAVRRGWTRGGSVLCALRRRTTDGHAPRARFELTRCQ